MLRQHAIALFVIGRGAGDINGHQNFAGLRMIWIEIDVGFEFFERAL